MSRLFVAATPPSEVLDRIADLPRPDEPGIRWTRRHQWHVTLRFLGDAPVDDVIARLTRVAHPVVTVEVGPAVSRLGRTIVCLPVAGIDDLAAAVVEATTDVGQPPEPRRFAGHITLGRLRHRGSCGLAGTPFRASFPVEEIELIDSRLGPDGPTYDTAWAGPLSR